MINLTVHKNTMEKRKRKDVRDHLIDDAKRLAKDSNISENISGYAIVVWSDDHDSQAAWMSGCLPSSLIGECFKQTMARQITTMITKSIVKGEQDA